MTGPVSDQTQTPFPKLLTRFVNPQNGQLEAPWHRFLIALWRKTGGSSPSVGNVTLQEQSDGSIFAFNLDGTFLGQVVLTGAIPGPPVVVVPGPTPYTYHALADGTLVVFSAAVELKRGLAGTYYQVTLTGGATPMKNGDFARLTWYSADAPMVTWFPDAA